MCPDLESERALLAVRLQSEIEQLEPGLRHAAARLPQRLGKSDSAATLADCFSDLTLLYPLLIGEGLVPSSLERIRCFLTPHALLVVYAHLDDRRRDGQMEIASAEERLADWLVGEARRQLNLAVGATGNREAIDVLLSLYAEAQATRVSDPDQLPGLVVRRHLPGIVSAMSLLDASHCERTRIERVAVGYRHLVLSLQWIDDLRDLEEDLATGADNLLLSRVPKSVRDGASLPAVISCVHDMGLLALALNEARRHLSAARDIASLLGCHSLASLLETRHRWVIDCERVHSDTMKFTGPELVDLAPPDE